MFEDQYNTWEIGTRTEVCENKLLKTSISPALSYDFVFFLNFFIAVIITYILTLIFLLSFCDSGFIKEHTVWFYQALEINIAV